MTYSYTNAKGQAYYLHTRVITLKGSGKEQRIYFFARDERPEATELPEGMEVVENPRTGLPVLRKS